MHNVHVCYVSVWVYNSVYVCVYKFVCGCTCVYICVWHMCVCTLCVYTCVWVCTCVLLCSLAAWTCVEHCLSFICWAGLLRGVRHLVMTTLGAPVINLNMGMIHKNKDEEVEGGLDNSLYQPADPLPLHLWWQASLSSLLQETLHMCTLPHFHKLQESTPLPAMSILPSYIDLLLTLSLLLVMTKTALYLVLCSRKR